MVISTNKLDESPVVYAPASVGVGGKRAVFELADAWAYAPVSPSIYGTGLLDEWKRGLLDVYVGLEKLSLLFGIRPVRPVWTVHSQQIDVSRWSMVTGEALDCPKSWDALAFTPEADPLRPRILISRLCAPDCQHLHPLDGEKLYEMAVHEFAHSLQVKGLVDWPIDVKYRNGDRCSREVTEFGKVVARRSHGSYVRLHPNMVEARDGEPDYGPLAREARKRQGLSPEPTAEELGVRVVVGS